MASYLDQYGAGEQKRETVLKTIVLSVIFLAIFGTLGWYLFKNHGQEREVKDFLSLVRNKDYQGAYQAWGCTAAKPCTGYSYEKFMDDWGGKNGSPVLRIVDSESCNAGVILTVDVTADRQEKLWVDKSSSALSFSPFPFCPNKTPLANMIHQTVGKLRKPFLN